MIGRKLANDREMRYTAIMTNDVDDAPFFQPLDIAYTLDAARPVLANHRPIRAGRAVQPHSHPRGQLLWAHDGVLRVSSGGNVWIVPPTHAMWIPGGLEHDLVTETDAHIRNLHVDPSALHRLARLGRDACSVRVMNPLMRALILKLCESDLSAPFDERTNRLVDVVLDELAALEEAPLSLPGGHDPRLVRLTRYLGTRPEDPRLLSELAAIAGASPRTLERLFVKETGLTFRAWRTRLRLLSAIERLNRGQSSTEIAHSLGYSSPSAFVAAFRGYFGRTPQQFLAA